MNPHAPPLALSNPLEIGLLALLQTFRDARPPLSPGAPKVLLLAAQSIVAFLYVHVGLAGLLVVLGPVHDGHLLTCKNETLVLV